MKSRLRAAAVIFGLTVVGVLAPAIPASATVITVTIPEDELDPTDGECSLREAIVASDQNIPSDIEGGCPAGNPISVGEDTIVLPTNTYPLTMGDFFCEGCDTIGPEASGDLDIYDGGLAGLGFVFGSAARAQATRVLTIQGNGSTIDACGLEHSEGVPAPDRIFEIYEGFGAEINDLTIQGGGGEFNTEAIPACELGFGSTNNIVGWGGGILVNPGAELNLVNSIVRRNSADFGGGIYNDQGVVEVQNGSVVGVVGDPNLEVNDGNYASDEGGGIYTAGASDNTLIVDASSVQGNVARTHGGGIYNGGAQVQEGDRVEIRNGSNISQNLAGFECLDIQNGEVGGNGGGIWSNAQAEFVENGDTPTLTADSPGVFIDASTVDGNVALFCGGGGGAGYGGGIFNTDGGHVEITGGSVIGPDNFAELNGGGIWTSGGVRLLSETLLINESTIEGNAAAQHGGGIYSLFDNVDIENSTITDNTAAFGDGGGIWFEGQHANGGSIGLTILNSTISFNEALEPEVDASGLGGGIYHHGGPMTLDSSTVDQNEADVAGGNIALGENELSTFPEAHFHNTIISNGTVDGLPQNCANDGGILISDGFNLTNEDPTDCGLDQPTDILGQDPNLEDDLLPNGGLTETQALLPGSPAIDTGSNPCPPRDQRGTSRPQDGDGDGTPVCDRGAFEVEGTPEGGPAGQEPPPPLPPRICQIIGTSADDILLGTPAGETICGLQGDDLIRGGDGNDNLFGDEDDDRLNGGLGSDALVGGPGTDTGDYSDAPGSVDANLTTGAATGVGASTDGLFTLENLIGSAFDDVLTGDGGPNNLKGKAGNDRMNGRGGNDTMRGARGNDKGRGSAGNDTVKGGHDRDRLKGGGGDDTITGGQKKDNLKGNGGDDNVRGGGGDDKLNGNAGTDECNGGSGTNQISNCET